MMSRSGGQKYAQTETNAGRRELEVWVHGGGAGAGGGGLVLLLLAFGDITKE